MLSWLAVNGTAAIVEFPGVLYRGGAEQKIRKYLVDNNYVDTVIQLPPDLFFGTTIATCIIVLKKSKADNKTLFIDASKEFVRQGNKNKLTEANQQKILDAFTARADADHFATLVENGDDRRERLQHRGLVLRRGRGHPRGRRHHGAQRRDRADRRAAGRAAAGDRRDRRRPRRRRGVSRIDDLIAELCPDGVEFKTARRGRGVRTSATRHAKVDSDWEGGTIPCDALRQVNTRNGLGRQDDHSCRIRLCSAKTVPPNTVDLHHRGHGENVRTSQGRSRWLCDEINRYDCDRHRCIAEQRLLSTTSCQTQYRSCRSVSTGDGARGGLESRRS